MLKRGPETAKAAANFGEGRLPRELIRAYGEVKLAALRSVQRIDMRWRDELFRLIEESLFEIIRGERDEEFPLPLAQGGAGTSIHLNLNEVLAALVTERSGEELETLDTLDTVEDLARYQSTNDTFSAAVNIALLRGLIETEGAVIRLQEKLVALETGYDAYLTTGRTEMQDALPMGVGQLFGSWAGMIERDRWRLSKLAERIREIPLGGTAIGTCFTAPREYVNQATTELRSITGLPLARSQNLPDAVSHKDALAELASGYALAAGNLITIAEDLLYYTSSAVAEFRHPELQWGSSIMPVKVNPVLLEFAKGLAIRVGTSAEAVRLYARESRLQLNAFLPFLYDSLSSAEADLRKALAGMLRFLEEAQVDTDRMEANLAASPALLNALLPRVGYHRLKPLIAEFLVRPPANLQDFQMRAAASLDIAPETMAQWLKPDSLIAAENPNRRRT